MVHDNFQSNALWFTW